MPNIIRTEAELLALFADNNDGLITAQDLRDFVVSARVDENWYGPQGSQGSQGAQGNQGPQGFAGSQGAQGIRGFQGYQGIQGYQGTQGAGFQGVQGGTGLQGNQGWQGFQGLGYQGIQGNQGAIGVQGAQGRQGNQGLQGLQGTQGAGFQGLQGTQGLQGLQGTQGAGFQGVQGLQGLQGLQGTQGAGFQGEQGFQGNRGQQGDLGFQGLQGYQGFGLQGLQGNLGLQGVQGAGFQGLQGQRGYQGRLGTILASMAYFNDTLQTISSSTPTKVQWDVLDTDNSKGETGLTFNGTDRFVNTSGADAIYTITGFISWDQGTTGSTRKIYLVKNNNTTGNEGRHAYVALPAPVNTESAVVEFSCNILLCDFDYFEVFVEHDEAGNLDINVDAGYPGSRIVIVRQEGVMGNQGYQGAGFQGDTGLQGNQGFQGTQGAGFQGDTGLQGLQGQQGAGFQGDTGLQGQIGLQGFQGRQGHQGVLGPQGNQGFQGRQGRQGFQGVEGVQGQQGLQGPSGAALISLSYFSNTVQSITSSIETAVTWNTLDATNSKGTSGLTFNGTNRFTNNTGSDALYIVSGYITWEDLGSTSTSRGVSIVKNGNILGSNGRFSYLNVANSSNYSATSFAGNVLLENGDYFEVYVYHDEVSAQDINTETNFPGSRIFIVRSDGTAGYQGFQGSTGGPQGNQGFQGTEGLQGYQGTQGSGFQGEQGSGFQGEQGLQGDQGFQGIQGFGLQGQQGYQGDGSVLYTNATAVPSTIGGIAAGSTFTNQTMQQMWDALLYPYQSPTFASFSISGQSTPIEVGTTISGTKTFAWSTTNSSNVQTNTVDINDVTNSVVLLTSSANDGSEVITLPSSITKTVPSSHQWQISAVNTNIITFNRTFTVNWYWKIYYGTSSNVTLTESDIESLANSGLVNTYAGSFVYVSGGYKYFCIPDSFGSPNSFKDDATNLTVAMATNSDDVFYSNIANGIYYGLVSVTNVNGNTTNYRVYRTKNILGGSITIDVL